MAMLIILKRVIIYLEFFFVTNFYVFSKDLGKYGLMYYNSLFMVLPSLFFCVQSGDLETTLGNTRDHKTTLGNTRNYKTTLGNTRNHKTILGNTRNYKTTLGNTRNYKTTLGNTWNHIR